MATLGTRLFVKLFCEAVGQDSYGNTYYQAKNCKQSERKKRMVIYKGIDDASKVPALWHSWLHYAIDELPVNQVDCKGGKSHIPNLTGTECAYVPSGHKDSLKNGKRDKATGDYQAWEPIN